ncbi:MAG: hypothetical protein GY759_20020 [Chloroflexi bacterium]|nr:hypothetical protein [Chloroflexota bacterium]
MSGLATATSVLAFGLILWLGLYLLSRDPADPLLRWSSAGLVTYALVVALLPIAAVAEEAVVGNVGATRSFLILLPALCWTGTLLHLLPESDPLRWRLIRVWPVLFLLWLIGLALLFVIAFERAGQLLFSVAPLIAAFILLIRQLQAFRRRQGIGVALAATIFFIMGLGLLLIPQQWLSTTWMLLAISVDFILFGLAVAWLDAFAQGETFLPDLLRSFDYAFFTALLFGGQIALVMWLSTGMTAPMLFLLLGAIAAAVLAQTFAMPLQTYLDRFALSSSPEAQRDRDALRTAATIRPRRDDSLDLLALDEEEFARLTRRALSHFGNLPRLAISPLTRLPVIDQHLAASHAQPGTLERADALKALLVESIERLSPDGKSGFSSTDEWRHYNSVYYPYIEGLKPYSRRASHDDLDENAGAALDWFRSQALERTLYNWQNAAAKLIAQDLRERSGMR